MQLHDLGLVARRGLGRLAEASCLRPLPVPTPEVAILLLHQAAIGLRSLMAQLLLPYFGLNLGKPYVVTPPRIHDFASFVDARWGAKVVATRYDDQSSGKWPKRRPYTLLPFLFWTQSHLVVEPAFTLAHPKPLTGMQHVLVFGTG